MTWKLILETKGEKPRYVVIDIQFIMCHALEKISDRVDRNFQIWDIGDGSVQKQEIPSGNPQHPAHACISSILGLGA